MLTYALHAATTNRDGDPVRRGDRIDFAAFDSGSGEGGGAGGD
jgi:hypothetical protein